MRAYNVEFFTREYEYVTNQLTDDFDYVIDYTSMTSNVVVVRNDDKINLGQFIRVEGAEKTITGIVVGVDRGTALTNVTYDPLLSLLDFDILFDTDLQGQGTLEDCFANIITATLINNSDTLQNITGLSVETTSATTNWGFNLKSTNEGMHHLIINFYDSMVAKALGKYGVVVDFDINFQRKTISCVIGKKTAYVRTIEADLPNIIEKSIVFHATSNSVNKAMIYNGANYSQVRTYYLHSDGTYDRTNTDRLSPVRFEVREVMLGEGQTFANAADSEARDVFSNKDNDNLIELTVLRGDTLVGAETLEIGDQVRVLNGSLEFKSMLSGYRLDENTTLVFGVIRQELTKIIRR